MNPKSLVHPKIRRIIKSGVRRIWSPDVNAAPHIHTTTHIVDSSNHRLVFIFHGHKGTWPGMGHSLYREKAIFRETIQRCSYQTEKLIGVKISDYFEGIKEFGAEDSEEETNLRHFCEVSLDIALCDLWKSVGAKPDAIVGVCRGEIPASYAAGALSLEDSMAVHNSMADIMREKNAEGYWLNLKLTFERAQLLALKSGEAFNICVETSPNMVLGYCTVEDFEKVKHFLAVNKVGYRATPCTYLSHIFPAGDLKGIKQELFQPQPQPLSLPCYSSLLGDVIPTGTVLKPEYWYLAFLLPVQFTRTISAALTDEYDTFLNVCGRTPFDGGVRQTANALGKQIIVLDSVSSHEPELDVWNQSFKTLAEHGLIKTNSENLGGADESVASIATDLADDIFASKGAITRNPYPYYETLRQYGSVHYSPKNNGWVVLGYNDNSEALKRTDVFSSRRIGGFDDTLLDVDAPAHTRARRILAPYFTNSRIQELEDYVRAVANQLLDDATPDDEFDIVDNYAIPLTELVSGRFIGLSEDEFKLFSQAHQEHKFKIHMMAPLFETQARKLVERLQKTPGQGLCNQLLYPVGEEALTPEEIVSVMRLLFFAAPMTTGILIATSTLVLLRYPTLRDELLADLSQIPTFIEESMRFDSPEQWTTRSTTEATELGGVAIPKDANIRLFLGAANRDAEQFVNPEQFIMRSNSKSHLSFAVGPHYCIGATLARLEARIAIETLLSRWPDFVASRPLSLLSYSKSTHMHALEHLFIKAK